MHARLDLGAVRLLTRTGLDWTRKYPAIGAAVASLPARQAYARCFNSLDAPRDRFAVDSPLEGTGFEPSVPLLRKAILGVGNRRWRHERRSHLQVQARVGNAGLERLLVTFPFVEGLAVPEGLGRSRGAAVSRL
jgi:hypothetical protein